MARCAGLQVDSEQSIVLLRRLLPELIVVFNTSQLFSLLRDVNLSALCILRLFFTSEIRKGPLLEAVN